MSPSRNPLHFLPLAIAAILAFSTTAQAAPCIAPDNGGGTANIPESCAYSGDNMFILDGLAPGDSVVLNSPLLSTYTSLTRTLVATGENVAFNTEFLSLSLTGTGSLAAFSRTLTIPLTMQVHNDLRTPGAPVQTFTGEVMTLQGQINVDPDFDLLRITGGSTFGLPSPGQTTLTQSGANWAVDSFFDITVRIDFIGAGGGPLAGRSGSTTGTYRFQAIAPVPVPAAAWLFGSALGMLGWARRRMNA